MHPTGAYREFPDDFDRLARAKAKLELLLSEMDARLAEANGDLSVILAKWAGPSDQAAELAATLGFLNPPVEFVMFPRGLAHHDLFDTYPNFTHVQCLRVNDPTGPCYAEIPLGANAERTAEDVALIELPQDPVKKARVFDYFQSWIRVVAKLDVRTVRYEFPSRQRLRSLAHFAYVGQRLRELKGMGDPTPEEMRKNYAEVQQQMAAIGFDPEEGPRKFSATHRIAARLKPTPPPAPASVPAPVSPETVVAAKPLESREALRDRAEAFVKRLGDIFPGVRPLADALGCAPSSLMKAIESSPYLLARKAEYEARRQGKPTEQSLTDVHTDRIPQSTEPDPSQELDRLIAEQKADCRKDERRAKRPVHDRS